MNVQAIEAFLRQEFAIPSIRFEVSRRDHILYVFVTDSHLQDPDSFATLVDEAIAPLALPTITDLWVVDGTDQPQLNRWQRCFPYMPVVAMPHTGAEYVTSPGSIKVETYRAMVDAGADLVAGGHPHAVQSTEVYQGKLIVYSQGNFLFDQQRDRLRTTHLGLRVRISVQDPAYIQAATALPDHCFNSYTLCPELQSSLTKPTYRLHYEPFYTANPQRIPRAAYPAEVDYIKQVSKIDDALASLP